MKLFEHPDFEQAILRATAHFHNRGLRPAIIEKDYYVTEALRLIAAKTPAKSSSRVVLEKCPWLRRDFLRTFQIEVEDLRAQANFEVLEHMSDREQRDWAHFGRLCREWDRQFEDPDDVYLEAEEREKERGKQGLPPRLGIIPYEAIAAEETRLKAESRRKKRSRKTGS